VCEREVRAKHFRLDYYDATSKNTTLPVAKRPGRGEGAGGSVLRLVLVRADTGGSACRRPSLHNGC